MQNNSVSSLLQIDQVSVTYTQRAGLKKQTVQAVQEVSLQLAAGECLGMIGESGCGKSSLANAIMGLVPYQGNIAINNKPIVYRPDNIPLAQARTVQMVFQDPYASLNPRKSVFDILSTPLRLHGVESNKQAIHTRVMKMLDLVGLPTSAADKNPHAFSGGQRQRIAIARALILEPKVLICDEPVSALDVSIRAQIINLLMQLKQELHMALFVISHDLSVIEHMSDQVAVMYLGKVVEQGSWDRVFSQPQHPYTQALFSATLDPFQPIDLAERVMMGEPASPLQLPTGCAYHPRCSKAQVGVCTTQSPALQMYQPPHHMVRCILAQQ